MTFELNMLAEWSLPLDMEVWDLLISAGIFLTIVLGTLAIFRQPGEIKMSPQREVAIATGHMDRRTVFENPLLRPILWLLLAASHRLAMPRVKNWLGRKLVAAGSPNYYTVEEYLAMSLGLGIVVMVGLQVFNLLAYGQLSLVLLVFGLVAGIGLLIFHLHDKATKRLRRISRRVPYSLDLIALAMGAGATFTEAVRTVVRERSAESFPSPLHQDWRGDPFHVELRTVLAEMELGTTRRRALENLANRVPLEALRSIIASIIQAEELGTSLGDVLHDQATLLRLRRSFAAENKAAVASVRILIPCLLLVIAVMLAVFGPVIVRAVRGGLF